MLYSVVYWYSSGCVFWNNFNSSLRNGKLMVAVESLDVSGSQLFDNQKSYKQSGRIEESGSPYLQSIWAQRQVLLP